MRFLSMIRIDEKTIKPPTEKLTQRPAISWHRE